MTIVTQDFDLDKTGEVIHLLSFPSEQRNADWQTHFFAAIRYASLRALQPQIFTGPDGFPYFRMALPVEDKQFDAFSINHILKFCTEEAYCGVALFRDETTEEPEWVFTLGDLWSYRMFDNPMGDPEDLREIAQRNGNKSGGETLIVEKDTKLLSGAPSEEYLPHHQAIGLAGYLRHIGVENPAAALVLNAKWKPSRSLMLNIDPDMFEKATLDNRMERAKWFLPRSRALMHYSPGFCQLYPLAR